MLRWFISLPISAVALLVAHLGWAQDHISLAKVDRVRLDGVVIGNDGACKVDDDQIVTSIKFILNSAGIPFVEGWPVINEPLSDAERAKLRREVDIPALLVSSDIGSMASGCLYSLDVVLVENVEPTKLAYIDTPFSGTVRIWHVGSFGISQPSDLTAQLSKLVEQALKQFVNLRAADIKAAAQ